jgi:muramoyltetrapeptide carboxypeptidase
VLLAALYRAGFEAVAHGPVAQDILRDEGDAAAGRALAWMVDRAPETLEPTVGSAKKTAAFNMTVLSHLLGTPLQPDLDGHVLMLEEVGEAMYRIDRSLFHITSNAEIRRVSGIMLGRCSAITPNEPAFGMNEEEIARYWCRRAGIAWLGRADIGHDTNNKIVPFGPLRTTGPTRGPERMIDSPPFGRGCDLRTDGPLIAPKDRLPVDHQAHQNRSDRTQKRTRRVR